MDGDDLALLEAPVYDDEAQELRLAESLRAHPVSTATWAYRQGSYPVLHDWLDARVGTALHPDEFQEFPRIVAAITLTLDALPGLDALIASASSDALTLESVGLAEELD
jgi:hypothetical protein